METSVHHGARCSIASLAVFRIAFGLLMAGAMVRLIAYGWVDELFLRPRFHFPYAGFEWVRPLPGVWMYVHVVVVGLCAMGMAIGCRYRVCSVLFFLGFTWLELIDQTTYLNHYYLVSLLAGLLMFMPAHRQWSIDAWRNPALRTLTIPRWPVMLLRFQFAVVYVFAGIAKLNADWLIHAQPMKIWLAARSEMPLLGRLLEQSWTAHAASGFAAIYDLSVPFLLLATRTRPFAFAAVVVFHVLTWLLFSIGMFPWIMIAGSLLFFPADWPLKWLPVLRSELQNAEPVTRFPHWGRGLIALYVALQIVIPLRAGFCADDIAWTSRGFNWAWKVMIVEKRGHVTLIAYDPVRRARWTIDLMDTITPRQTVMMAQDPEMIRALAGFIAQQLREQGRGGVEIRAEAFASLNGRPGQRLIDPQVDLTKPPPAAWIMPLQPDHSAGKAAFASAREAAGKPSSH